MMLTLRKSDQRGRADYGWLDSRHTFSFGSYYDKNHMGFRTLRVINEDLVEAGEGFPTHPHANMEIVSYVVSGQLAHKDSMGSEEILRAGDVQAMTAGTGISHSEYNPSEDEPVHFLQIWIQPNHNNLTPRYADAHFDSEQKRNQLRLLISPEGADGSLKINQDVQMFASLLAPGKTINHSLSPGRAAWLQVISGNVRINGELVGSGDGVSVENLPLLEITAEQESHFLLFDLS